SDLVNILVSNSAGPFMVTSQTTTETYLAGEALEITWDVASTNLAPVDTETVDILLSTDGGETFPIVLAQGVSNDGLHEMVVPGMPTSEARIMVRAVDNIFFAVNSDDFVIEASEIVMNFAALEFEVCQFSDLTVPFTYETFMGFSEEVTFSVTDPPVGLNISFSPPTATANDTAVDLIIENTENVPEGSYPITITATSASISKSITAELNIFEATFNDVTMLAPTNGSADISTVTPLQWEENISYTAYDVQIATDASFTTIVEVANVVSNSYTPTALENNTTYFWRVKPENACGEGTFNSPFSFSTIPLDCDTINASGLPLAISNIGTPKIVSTVAFFEDLPIADINVNLDIDHDYLADLVVSLTSPSGTTVTLISNSCGDLKNVDATFDDDAENFICGVDANDGIKGIVRPLGSLNSLRGESILGEWILEVADNASSDGGSLNSFSLDICVEGTFRPDADNDGVFDDGDDLCLDTPEGSEVDSSGCPVYRFPSDNFTVSIESESCRNNDDGIITIEAFLPLDYELVVTGNGLNITDNFTATYSIANLTSGTYNLCISGTDANFEYEPYCFEVEVVQPDPLGVTSKITDNGKQVALSMIGADRYTIELNGKTIQTEKSEINLDLQVGSNVLRISTDMPCQGIFEDHLFISEEPVVFPNPFDTKTAVLLGSTEAVQIDIFTIEGRLLKSGHYVPNRPEIELDFMEFPSGTYFIKFKGAKVNGTIQVIKR
ncbi:MAG: T9SS type A sorting domain-containing protein, partial [Pricia sp.]|nr:T9SS type A sorting domain-containing protein [Pricia sp.]